MKSDDPSHFGPLSLGDPQLLSGIVQMRDGENGQLMVGKCNPGDFYVDGRIRCHFARVRWIVSILKGCLAFVFLMFQKYILTSNIDIFGAHLLLIIFAEYAG